MQCVFWEQSDSQFSWLPVSVLPMGVAFPIWNHDNMGICCHELLLVYDKPFTAQSMEDLNNFFLMMLHFNAIFKKYCVELSNLASLWVLKQNASVLTILVLFIPYAIQCRTKRGRKFLNTTTAQKRGGRENERKKRHYVQPMAFWTKQTQGTEIHAGIGFWWFILGCGSSLCFFFPNIRDSMGCQNFEKS